LSIRASKASQACLGFRAQRGGAVVVGVTVERGEPRVVLSTFLPTAEEGDRLAFEPYHVAAKMPRGRDGGASAAARAAVEEARKRQVALATKGLKAIVAKLAGEGHSSVDGALLVNRAGWMTDLLAYSLAFADHPPVAEGLQVRESLRRAFDKAKLKVSEIDEKTLTSLASEVRHLSPAALDARLKALGAAAGRPWRKEHKLACLAAWMSCVARK
jgi:hypothetical protein